MRRSTTKRAGCNNVPVLRRHRLANHMKVAVSCPLLGSKMEACLPHLLLKNIKCNSLISFVFYFWQWWKGATRNRHVLIRGFIHHEWCVAVIYCCAVYIFDISLYCDCIYCKLRSSVPLLWWTVPQLKAVRLQIRPYEYNLKTCKPHRKTLEQNQIPAPCLILSESNFSTHFEDRIVIFYIHLIQFIRKHLQSVRSVEDSRWYEDSYFI